MTEGTAVPQQKLVGAGWGQRFATLCLEDGWNSWSTATDHSPMEATPPPLSSRAYPNSYSTDLTGGPLCGSLKENHMQLTVSHSSLQEIWGSRGICGSTDPSWKRVYCPSQKPQG